MTDVIEAPVGYKKIKESCTLPEKIVSKKSNEIWLIRGAEDVCDFNWILIDQFPEEALEKIQMDLSKGSCKNYWLNLINSNFRIYIRWKKVCYDRR